MSQERQVTWLDVAFAFERRVKGVHFADRWELAWKALSQVDRRSVVDQLERRASLRKGAAERELQLAERLAEFAAGLRKKVGRS